MLQTGVSARFDQVRWAMERVRAGESKLERIGLPSGDQVTIYRDETAPIGIRIQTAGKPGGARRGPTSLKGPSGPGALGPAEASPGEEIRRREFGPTEERPWDYPDDLPFLPGHGVCVSHRALPGRPGRTRSSVWTGLPDPNRVLGALISQLQMQGWEEWKTSHNESYMGHTLSCFFKMGRAQRVLSLMAFGEFSQIMLFERMGE